MSLNNKSIHIYSWDEYEGIEESFKVDKAIVRIHNPNAKIRYGNESSKNVTWSFFSDVDYPELSFKEKMKFLFFKGDWRLFSFDKAKIMVKFLEENKDKDFIIVYEVYLNDNGVPNLDYDRRCLSVAKFLKNKYSHNLANKSEKDLDKANRLVSDIFLKF